MFRKQTVPGTRRLRFESLEERWCPASVVFNFEDQPATSKPRQGAFNSLELSKAGVTLTILRPDSSFDIIDNTVGDQVGKPTNFGDRTLDPFFDQSARPFVLNFSVPIKSFSVDVGDYGEDNDDMLQAVATSESDALGDIISRDSKILPTIGDNTFNTRRLKLDGEGIRSVVLIGGVSSHPHSVFYDNLRVEYEPDISITNAEWLPVTELSRGNARVRFQYSIVGESGPITVQAFQSEFANRKDGDKPLGPEITLDPANGREGTAVVHINEAPYHGGAKPFYVLLVAKTSSTSFSETDKSNNRTSVKVTQPSPLSFELERRAPLANNHRDRVKLWLQNNAGLINAEAARRNISAEAIAGVIAWEAMFTRKGAPGPASYGPGKLHAFELTGESLAVGAERLGYVRNVVGVDARIARLTRVDWSVRYIGGILDAFSDIAEAEGSTASIRHRPELLAAFYQGISPKVLGGKPLRLNNADTYFRDKVARGETYVLRGAMSLWVAANKRYLSSALK